MHFDNQAICAGRHRVSKRRIELTMGVEFLANGRAELVYSPRLIRKILDDVTMTTGRYPTRGELLALAGLGAPPRGDHADLGLTAESACCSGDSGAPTSCC